jgi:hypothetical protein
MKYTIEVDDTIASYLQKFANDCARPIEDLLADMIEENLQQGAEIDAALEEANVDVDGLDMPIVRAVRILASGLAYHRDNERRMTKNIPSLYTLRKIDALRGERSRDGFVCDLMDTFSRETP